MNRDAFEHVVRAAAAIVDDEIVVIGSQAILARYPSAPDSLLRSQELDVYPRNDPKRAIEIDGALGDGSRFHETFGYYAHGVGPETAIAPTGWEERLVRVDVSATGHNAHTATAWCLEPHDLILAKLAAGRQHDDEFVQEAIRAELVDPHELRRRAAWLPKTHRERTSERLAAILTCGDR